MEKTSGNAENRGNVFVRAKLLIMVIFPQSVKSLGDQTLRHFSRVTNFFPKLFCVETFKSREKEMPRQTHFVGQFILKRFVDCGIAFPNHNASLFDLFTSNPQHPFKASNFSKSFSTNFSLRTKHEVSSTYWDNLYSLLLAFEIYTRYQYVVSY